MEDEVKIPSPEELETKPKEEEVVVDEETVKAKPDYEEMARAKGWRPEEEYEGDTPWVDAKEFMGRQPLFDALHKLSKKNKDLAATVDNLVDHNRKIKEAEYKRAIEDLKKQKVQALDSDDNETVVEIDDKIDAVKRAAEAETAAKPSRVYEEFVENNPWYESDQRMRTYATRIGYEYAEDNPAASENEIFTYVEKTVKDAYPEKFENPKRKAAPAVATPKSGKTPSKKAKLSETDLTYEERQIMNNILRNSPLSKEDYLDQLATAR